MRFGPYRLERRLAVGGMGEVFLARDRAGRHVVLKRLLSSLADDPHFVHLFEDEARLAARFEHPNLVKVHGLEKIDGQLCIVMEYVEGRDLGTIIAALRRTGRRMPVAIAARLICEVAAALHYAHELELPTGERLEVVHRDVSPANVMLSNSGEVKLLDFGVAKHLDRRQLTVAGETKGKQGYMAPEQLRRRQVDRRSDVFALGVVAFELLTGRLPIEGSTTYEQLRAAHEGHYRRIEDLRADVPPRLARALDRMIAHDPTQRFATAADVAREMSQLMREVGRPKKEAMVRWIDRACGTRPPELRITEPAKTARPPSAVATERMQIVVQRSSRFIAAAAALVLIALPAALWSYSTTQTSEPSAAATAIEALAPVPETTVYSVVPAPVPAPAPLLVAKKPRAAKRAPKPDMPKSYAPSVAAASVVAVSAAKPAGEPRRPIITSRGPVIPAGTRPAAIEIERELGPGVDEPEAPGLRWVSPWAEGKNDVSYSIRRLPR
jgi:eukaryotic-like serine/threonine-protein kinase